MGTYKSIPSLSILVEQLERLPGVGHKSAERLAYHVLTMPDADAQKLTSAINNARSKIRYCSICCNLSDSEICPICSDKSRDRSTICVVEDPKDIFAFEKTNEFNMTYHVLHGALSPMQNIGPDDLKIKELFARLSGDEVKEVIMGLSSTVTGEATSMYLSKLIKPLGIKVTRLGFGIPVGADLEYADEVTLKRSVITRTEI